MALSSPPIWGNLLLFFGLYCLGYALVHAIEYVAEFEISGVVELVIFWASAEWAGNRFLRMSSGRWDRGDRRRLALGYTAVALVALVFSLALSLLFSLELRIVTADALPFFAVMTTLITLAQYGLARWALARVDERAPSGVTQ